MENAFIGYFAVRFVTGSERKRNGRHDVNGTHKFVRRDTAHLLHYVSVPFAYLNCGQGGIVDLKSLFELVGTQAVLEAKILRGESAS